MLQPTPRRPRHPVPALLLVLTVLLTACSGGGGDDQPSGGQSGPPPASTPSAAPTPDPAPTVGQCHRIGWEAALAPVAPERTVPCRQRHTSQTYFVGRLGAATDVDDAASGRRVARTCTRRLGAHVGADARALRLTMLQPVWFTPSLEQADLGADWFRCDVVVVVAEETLGSLPRRTAGMAGDDAVAMCGTFRPGTKRFRRVACARRHTWRAVASVDLDARTYPSAERARTAMEDACRTAAQDRTDDPLEFSWSEERPTRAQWRAGRRYGLCWVPTAG